MVLKNWTQKKGVCTSVLDSFLKMVDLERCGVLFLCGFSAYFLRKNRIFLYMDIDTEEIVADFLTTYGREVFEIADRLLIELMEVA